MKTSSASAGGGAGGAVVVVVVVSSGDAGNVCDTSSRALLVAALTAALPIVVVAGVLAVEAVTGWFDNHNEERSIGIMFEASVGDDCTAISSTSSLDSPFSTGDCVSPCWVTSRTFFPLLFLALAVDGGPSLSGGGCTTTFPLFATTLAFPVAFGVGGLEDWTFVAPRYSPAEMLQGAEKTRTCEAFPRLWTR